MILPFHFGMWSLSLQILIVSVGEGLLLPLLRCQIAHLIQHIFNENPIPRSRIVYENVRHSSYELAVLNYRRAT